MQITHVGYTGGHPEHAKPADGLVLQVDDTGIRLRRFRDLFTVPWADVTALHIEGPEQAEKRFTATRLVALGPLGLAAKKTTSDAYMHVETASYSVGFQIPKTSAGELRSKLGRWTSRLPAPQIDVPSPPPPPGPPPGWYADPQGAAAQRWWDGTTWTEHVQ
jgi:hypothetical protein